MLVDAQKARNLKVHTISDTALNGSPSLQETLETWLAGRTEEVIVGIEVRHDGTNYFATILYTE